MTIERRFPSHYIPREFQLRGEVAIIRDKGSDTVIDPVEARAGTSLLEELKKWQRIHEDFGPIEDFPAEPVRF